ncbi:MAG: HAD family phosphatase [Chlamydiae bacterium]|nr:HAD family phosphatase [Chlamydiota bacterium]MBI3267223.1 HAD family phosphatase [Chlamydiota bacterium]
MKPSIPDPQFLKGLLFDLDGVLVDSMRLHDRAWRKALLDWGLEVSPEEIFLREGEKGSLTAHDLLKKAGREPHPELIDELIREKGKWFRQGARAEFFEGALSLIRFLRGKKYRLGLVTGSYSAEVKVLLGEDFLSNFEVVVTGDDVHQGKPHPEPYLRALEKLGLEASGVWVIENAPYGIRSAKAAGLTCLALATSLPASYLEEADLILSNLKEVRRLFEI